MGWFGTATGHIVVQIVVGAISGAIQAISGINFGAYNAVIQGGASIVAEAVAKIK